MATPIAARGPDEQLCDLPPLLPGLEQAGVAGGRTSWAAAERVEAPKLLCLAGPGLRAHIAIRNARSDAHKDPAWASD